ncbi:hypothetical protein LTR62_003410 [Meristemomyces frigidus]|uniref:Transcription factor Rba50 n=1 Tax=Meristemomyces frigidus TaxID=1508187 RepID=A0AAN7TLB0_9PEZI|nr:hypothetical protein LTR62_003410 [Meristemomyces frigidus]
MIQGQRFELNLDSDDEDTPQKSTVLPASFVADVLERQPGTTKPPSLPTLKSKTGFPEHRIRSGPSSSQQPAPNKSPDPPAPTFNNHVPSNGGDGGNSKPDSWLQEEKRRIDSENTAKLAAMSPAEIEEERQELLRNLSPSFIERLLQRSNIDSGSNETDLSNKEELSPASEREAVKTTARKTVTFAEERDDLATTEHESETVKAAPRKTVIFADETDDPTNEPDDSTTNEHDPDTIEGPATDPLPHDTVHFPHAPQPPSLDPSSATFLTDLHTKYFPSLPTEPEKLAWMQPDPTTTTTTTKTNIHTNPYDQQPGAPDFRPQDLRFAFTGALLPPRTAAEIPVSAGLHHHGADPEAAGYTIGELAHLSRSSFPAQRCIAFQTLGRILFRLGSGAFGNPREPGGWNVDGVEGQEGEGALARGLWRAMEEERVIDGLVGESEGLGVDGGRHVSARAYATEAVHLWRKGGGRRG